MDILTQEFGPFASVRLSLYDYQPTDLRRDAEDLEGEKRRAWQRVQAHQDLLEARRELHARYRAELTRVESEMDALETRLEELTDLSLVLENKVMQYNLKVSEMEADTTNLTERDLTTHAAMEGAWHDANEAAIENIHALADFCDRLWSHGRMMVERDGVDPDSEDFEQFQKMFEDAYWRGESWARNFIVLASEDQPDA